MGIGIRIVGSLPFRFCSGARRMYGRVGLFLDFRSPATSLGRAEARLTVGGGREDCFFGGADTRRSLSKSVLFGGQGLLDMAEMLSYMVGLKDE